MHKNAFSFHWLPLKRKVFGSVNDGAILQFVNQKKSKLTAASLMQMYFCDSKVTDPNLNSSGFSPKFVSLKTSLKLKGKF